MSLKSKTFAHNDKQYEVIANSDEEKFIVHVEQNGKRVAGPYTVTHVTELDRRLQNGDSLLDHLMELAESDVKLGYWPTAS